jgi:hypothetical protein
MVKKALLVLLVVVLGLHIRGYNRFDVDGASEWLKENSMARSKTCCAWWVMRAMQEGGLPAVILPAWAYEYYLPVLGFQEIEAGKGYKPEKGDIYVYQRAGTSMWGHIAMWTGAQWMSDFKQKGVCVSKNYQGVKPVYFRHRSQIGN